MKLPNGYGNITKLSGRRRKPWRVRKTLGWEIDPETEKLRQKYINIGYYATKSEALAALAAYNQNPYDVNAAKTTFSELYELWSEQHFQKISDSNIVGVRSAYKICESIYNRKFAELKLSDYQYVFDKSGKNAPMLKKLRTVLNLMYDYAIKHEIVPESKKNIIAAIEIKSGNPNKITHTSFSKTEINLLWKYSNNRLVQMALMLIYGGYRISEFCGIEKEQVNIDDQSVNILDSKTTNGIRVVPIADKVLHFYKSFMQEEGKYLVSNTKGQIINYENYYRRYWNPLMDNLAKEGMTKHRVHDTRHTTITMLTEARVDERFIAKIVGHSQKSLAQKVYSHVSNEVLLAEINKI